MRRRKTLLALIFGLSLLISGDSFSWAQIDFGNFTITGEAEVGGFLDI